MKVVNYLRDLLKMPESKYSVERVSFYGRNDSNLILCIPHYVRQLICYLHIDFRILAQVQSELNWQVSVISFYNNQCFTWTSELLLPILSPWISLNISLWCASSKVIVAILLEVAMTWLAVFVSKFSSTWISLSTVSSLMCALKI